MMVDDAFLHWFAGFFAGEGCFLIVHRNRRYGDFSTRVVLALRDDDIDILLEIQEVLRVGSVYAKKVREDKGNPQVQWMAFSKADCNVLVNIFEHHPLRAKKGREFGIWKKAVVELRKPPQQRNEKYLLYLHDKLLLIRQYQSDIAQIPSCGSDKDYFQLTYWEGEDAI